MPLRGVGWSLFCVILLLVAVACGAKRDAQSATASGRDPKVMTGPNAQGTLAKSVAAEITRLRPGTQIEIVGPLDLKVKTELELQVYLGNLESECKQTPASCNERISNFARAVVNVHSNKLSEQTLFPVLKNQAWVSQAEQTLARKGQPKTLLAFPLVDDLRVVLVEDTPLMTRPLSEEDIQQIGLTKAQARARALDNLKRSTSGFKVSEPKPGLYALAFKNGYDASMMILHPEWGALRSRIAGYLVVAPIARDIILFTGTKNQEAFEMLLTIIEVEKKEPSAAYPISTKLYRWEEDGDSRQSP